MKKTITYACLGISLITIASSFHVDEILLRFFIAGEIPGTTYAMPALAMMAFYSVVFLAVTTMLYQTWIDRLFETTDTAQLSLIQSE